MSWLNPKHINPSGEDSDIRAESRVEEFFHLRGALGRIALEAWNTVDPLHCLSMPDEYLGYAKRFVEAALRISPEEWTRRPGLIKELVKRSFYPEQVVPDTRGFAWASAEDIARIAVSIASAADSCGGMEKLVE